MERFRHTWLGIALLVWAAVGIGAEVPAEAESVSLSELVGNRDKYEGKAVVVIGYLSIGFEKRSLCPTAKQLAGKDCVWLDIDSDRWRKLSGKQVAVRGTYSKRFTGHLGCCSGTLDVAEVSAL